MSTGTGLMHEIMRRVGSLPTVRIFRHNVGMGWVGGKVKRRRDGSVVIPNARPLHAGLINGGSDLIGWTVYQIKPEDVGRVVAIFTGIEVKDGSGRPDEDQLNFIDQVRAAGGIAGVARSVDEALALVGATRDISGELLADSASGTIGRRKGESRGREQQSKTAKPESYSRETRS